MDRPTYEDAPGVELAERVDMFGELNELISGEGLWWMGLCQGEMWMEKGGKEEFIFQFDFLARHRAVLGGTLRRALVSEDSVDLFSQAGVLAFDPLIRFLEAIFDAEDFESLLVPSPYKALSAGRLNFVRAWTTVAECCGLSSILHAWAYFHGRLGTRERKRRFLLRRDSADLNSLRAACRNRNPYAILEVWTIFLEEFSEEECRSLFRDTIYRVRESLRFKQGAGLNWILFLLSNEVIEAKEATRLLLGSNVLGHRYMLHFQFSLYPLPPPTYAILQHFLAYGKLPANVILPQMRRHYAILSRACIEFSSWIGMDEDFEVRLGREFESLRAPVLSFPPLLGDGQGGLPPLYNWNGKRMCETQPKAFVVLLSKQLWLEERFLGRTEVVERLKQGWYWIFRFFPVLPTDGGAADDKGSIKSLLVLFLAVLSLSLRREEVSEILTADSDHDGTAFHWALDCGDPGAFRALYDVARWSMAEDALSRTHAIGGRTRDRKTVLQLLLESQQKGLFNN